MGKVVPFITSSVLGESFVTNALAVLFTGEIRVGKTFVVASVVGAKIGGMFWGASVVANDMLWINNSFISYVWFMGEGAEISEFVSFFIGEIVVVDVIGSMLINVSIVVLSVWVISVWFDSTLVIFSAIKIFVGVVDGGRYCVVLKGDCDLTKDIVVVIFSVVVGMGVVTSINIIGESI